MPWFDPRDASGEWVCERVTSFRACRVEAHSDCRDCGREGRDPQRAAAEVGGWMRMLWGGGDDCGEVGKMG